MLLQTLRDIEDASASDVFLLFADDFVSADPFTSIVVERLREEHRMACAAAVEQNRAPLPPLPGALFDLSQPASRRLEDALRFARSLLPPRGGHRLVWAMMPQHIHDRQDYLRLVSS